MACSSNCTSGPHESYGQCLRAKSLRLGSLNSPGEKQLQKELRMMDECKQYGVVPRTGKERDMVAALHSSEKYGRAFDAAKPLESATGVAGLDG